jgi:hypothetical protein
LLTTPVKASEQSQRSTTPTRLTRPTLWYDTAAPLPVMADAPFPTRRVCSACTDHGDRRAGGVFGEVDTRGDRQDARDACCDSGCRARYAGRFDGLATAALQGQ